MGKIWGKYYQHQLVKIYLDVCHLLKNQSTVKHFAMSIECLQDTHHIKGLKAW